MKRYRALDAASLTMAAALTVSIDAGSEPARHRVDERDLERMAVKHPGARDLLEEGEALRLRGQLSEVLGAFREAAAEAPESALVARRECETLTLLGQRAEAIQACLRALKNEGSALDMRAIVAAYMSGPDQPTTGELAQAMRLARRARESTPAEPWGYAAECDIAARIRDLQMFATCLGELQRVAPEDVETKRAEVLEAKLGLTRPRWLGWLAIAAAALGTLAHAARQRSRAAARWGRAAVTLLTLALLVLPPRSARAEGPAQPSDPDTPKNGMLSQWPVDDKDPESSVPPENKKERNPLQFGYWLMDLTWKAEKATKSGDHQAAMKYYRALVKAVPDRSVSFTRLCESYEALDDWKSAVEACATALTRDGVTLNDYQHYFKLALAKTGKLGSQEIGVLSEVIKHLREDPVGRSAADDLECQLALRIEDMSRLEACTTALAAKSPDDPKTISFQWALALKRKDYKGAEDLIERARETDMEQAGIDQMERGIASIKASQRRTMYAWGFGGLALLAAAATGAVAVTRRRRAAPRTA